MAAQEFTGDLRGARFVEADLSGVVMRAVDLAGADVDAPWLLDGESTFVVNGVDVAPLVEAELNRRMPGRAERRAESPEALRSAWDAVAQAWADGVARVEAMPATARDASVGGEWSFAQTLRHLVMATDVWLGRAILRSEHALHPIGVPDSSYAAGGGDPSVFSEVDPSWDRVLEVRAERQAMVASLLATVDDALLAEERRNPWADEHAETVRSCLHTILEEEWEHLRFALRDLDLLEARPVEQERRRAASVREVQVTFDCAHPRTIADYWCAALGYELPPSVLEGDGSWAAAVDPSGAGPRLSFQRVPEGKVVENRVHLDVRVATGIVGEERVAVLEAECARLVALGGTRVRLLEATDEDESCLVMQDPEGNEHCLD